MRSKFKWIFTLLVAFTMQFSFAQQKTVTGTVTSEGKALPGATVSIAGTKLGTQTDENGKFSIKASQGDVLDIAFFGKVSQTATVGAGNVVNVVLTSSSATDIEVVQVVGALGIKKRVDAQTSAAQLVKNKEITQAANPNVIQSLAGKVSGLQINMTANGVNPTSRIVLRGSRSLTGKNEALVVIDNAISTATILSQMSPDLIETINVVKGQQGAALYGEQGSNGVIVVTTRKGSKSSKIEVSLNTSADFQNILFLPKKQEKYGQGWGVGNYDFNFNNPTDPRNGNTQYSPFENGSWGPSFSDPAWAGTQVPVGLPQADGSLITETWKSRGYDNVKDFFRTGTVFQTNVSVNAGSEDGYTMFNYGRQDTDFVVEGDKLKRNTFMFKAGKRVKRLRMDGSVQYTNQSVTQTDSNLLDELLQTPTNVDLSKFRNSGTAHNYSAYTLNPYQVIKQKRFDDKTNNFNGNLQFNYEINKNISASYNGNIQLNSIISTQHNDGFKQDYVLDFSSILNSPTYNGELYSAAGGADQYEVSSFYITTNSARNYYGDLMLNFDYDLSKDLNLKFNIGNNLQEQYNLFTQQGGKNLEIEGWYNIKNVAKPDTPSSLLNGYTLRRRASGFANVDLDYKNYLFLNLTGRYERSSAAPKAFFYPSAGISFVPTKAFESLKGKTLNYAKVYANYAKVGSVSAINTFGLTNVSPGATGFPFNNGNVDIFGFNPRTAGVTQTIQPEFVISKELGLNLGFFNDRITLEGTIYQNDTQKLITRATTSSFSGLLANQDNIGNLRNTGFEVDLGVVPFRSTDGFNWSFKTGYTHYETIVKSLNPGVTEVALANGNGVGIFAVVGEQFPLIKATEYQKDANGNIIVGSNGIPLITSTLQKAGKVNPDFIINLSNTFSYKGFSLTAVADYRAGNSVYSQTYNRLFFSGSDLGSGDVDRENGFVVPNSVFNSGTPSVPNYVTNTTAIAPVNLPLWGATNANVGSLSVVDGSVVKIREIALAYSIPAKMLKNSGITSMKFGVNARNPFIFFVNNGNGIKNQGYTDPEASFTTGNGQGISNLGQYPATKTYGVSLNLTF
jgi:TonB-linked SusC/RagA family outer membrane protein